MNKENIEELINSLINSGIVKRTTLEVLDIYNNFELDDDSKYLLEDILGLYKEYLNSLLILNEHKEVFLKTLKQEEIKRNQALENVSPFLIQMFMNAKHKSATNLTIQIMKERNLFSKDDLILINKTILNGLSLSLDNSANHLRTANNSFVGKFKTENGKIKFIDDVSYIPIDYSDINEALYRILDILNKTDFVNIESIFVNPIFLHGFIAALQCFKDGNSRLARILFHCKLWQLTNFFYNSNLESPALFTSEAILHYEKQEIYRELIKQMAINPNNENFNKWLQFNLLLVEKQIYLNQDKMHECMRILKRS